MDSRWREELDKLKQKLLGISTGKRKNRQQKRLQAEVELLSLVAKLYWETGDEDPRNNWDDMLKAHALYNSCAVRSSGDNATDFVKKALLVQNRYRHGYSTVSLPELLSLKNKHKQAISAIRSHTRSDLQPLRSRTKSLNTSSGVNQFCESMKQVAKTCNDLMLDFAKMIVEDAIDIVGVPPCSFTIGAKGSLARGEATPYSDLEFFFVIETKTHKTKQYFMNLAMNIYFLIGNMQETDLHHMNIGELNGWFEDLEMSGVKIDGLTRKAGNIPTGNGVTDKKNKYITSGEELFEKYRILYTNPKPEDAIMGDDSAMLAFIREIYSHSSTNFLDAFADEQQHTTMNHERRQITEKMLKADIDKYQLDEATFVEDRLIEVKSKIYRYPSLVIIDLSILFEIYGAPSSWDALEQLYAYGKISHSYKQALHNLLALASYVRMCTYLFHKSQTEYMATPNPLHVPKKKGKRGRKCYLVSYRVFKSVIVYMRSLANNLLPVEKMMSSLALREIEGAAIADRFAAI